MLREKLAPSKNACQNRVLEMKSKSCWPKILSM